LVLAKTVIEMAKTKGSNDKTCGDVAGKVAVVRSTLEAALEHGDQKGDAAVAQLHRNMMSLQQELDAYLSYAFVYKFMCASAIQQTFQKLLDDLDSSTHDFTASIAAKNANNHAMLEELAAQFANEKKLAEERSTKIDATMESNAVYFKF